LCNKADLDYSRERNFVEKYDQLLTKGMHDYDIGYRLWEHYNKMHIAWEDIRKELDSYLNDPSSFKPLSKAELHELNRLHWNVYQN
jgi:hypothetical protein